MSTTTIQTPDAATIGKFSSEIATADAAKGDHEAQLAIALTTLAEQAAADVTAIYAVTDALTGGTTQAGPVRSVHCVVDANVSNLAAFAGVTGGTPVDGVTNVAGNRVLLVNQTTATQDGIYVVGTVASGTAPLTRAADYANASVQPPGLEVNVNQGTLWGNKTWFASLAGAITVGTSEPEFYPREYVRVTTAMAGTPGVKALSAEWILSATKSSATPVVKAPGGTPGFLSVGTLTAGAGNGSFTVTSTENETSTLQVQITN